MTKYIATYDSIVATAVANIREQKGLTQAELAEAVGVTASTWSRIESGQTGLSLDQLKKASEALDFRPHEVLEISDKLIEKVQEVEVASKKDIELALRVLPIAGVAAGLVIPLAGRFLGAAVGVGLTALVSEFLRQKQAEPSEPE